MRDIVGQIAFDSDPVPRHIERTPDPGGTLPHLSLGGPIAYSSNAGVIAIKGEPRLADAQDVAAVARRVLESYVADGADALAELRGPFALVIMVPRARKCLIAIDRMGVERLAWGRKNGWIAVGSSAFDVAQGLASAPALNHQALFNFMYSHMVPAPGTVFQDVSKLLPGTAVEFAENGQREFHHSRQEWLL